ncbi:MAG: HTH domain-containing protein [Bacteroidota bacterium]
MNLLTQIERLERLDQLIRLKATGTPEELAKRLKVSRSTLYNIFEFIKRQGVKVAYCAQRQSYYYETNTYFCFGFFTEKVQLKQVKGGQGNNYWDFLGSPEFLDCGSLILSHQR